MDREIGTRFIAQKGEINFAELWASIDRPGNVISHYNDMFNRTVPLRLRDPVFINERREYRRV